MEDAKRFAAVRFGDIVARISFYERKGLVGQLSTVVAHDGVLMALVLSAMHEIQGVAKRDEVRGQAEFLLSCINRQSKPGQ